MTRHQYGISGFVPQTSLLGETSVGVAKWQLVSQANELHNLSPEKKINQNSHGFVLFTC